MLHWPPVVILAEFEAHDWLVSLVILLMFGMSVAKVLSIRRHWRLGPVGRKKGDLWGRILAATVGLYLGVVYLLILVEVIPHSPNGLLFNLPGIAILAALEIYHSIREW